MSTRKILFAGILVLLLAIGFGWYQFSRGHADLTKAKPDFQLAATELHAAFVQDYNQSSQRYVGKVLAVSGQVNNVQRSETGTVVALKASEMGDILCSLAGESPEGLSEGQKITLVGECTGALGDADLGLLDVNLVRCVLK